MSNYKTISDLSDKEFFRSPYEKRISEKYELTYKTKSNLSEQEFFMVTRNWNPFINNR